MVDSLYAEMGQLPVAPGTGGGEAPGLPGFSGQWRLRLPAEGRSPDLEVGGVAVRMNKPLSGQRLMVWFCKHITEELIRPTISVRRYWPGGKPGVCQPMNLSKNCSQLVLTEPTLAFIDHPLVFQMLTKPSS